jgi:large repetitive protein
MGRSGGLHRAVVVVATLALGLVASLLSTSAVGAVVATTGPGTMSVSPAVVLPSSTGSAFTFTYTAGSSGISSGKVKLVVPAGWSVPQKAHATAAGYVAASAGTLAVVGSVVWVDALTLCSLCSVTISYKDVSAPATAQTSTFDASVAVTGATVSPLATSPVVTVSSTPIITSVTPANGQLTVDFIAPTEDPPAYEFIATCGSLAASVPVVTPIVVPGLTNGVSVPCTVAAVNADGTGPSSPPVSGTPEAQVPGPSTIALVSPGNDQLTVDYAEAADNGSPVLSYTVTCGTQSVTTDQTTDVTVTGLVDGTTYSCDVVATNAIGNGPPSTSVSGTPEVVVPDAPTVMSVSSGKKSLTVTYLAADGNGATITGYTAACGTESATVSGTSLSATVKGVPDGTALDCTLVATDAAGSGPSADWTGLPGPPATPVISSVVPGDGQLTVVYGALTVGFGGSADGPSGYTAKCGSKSTSVNGNTTWATVTGLKNGKSYPCTVLATNPAGKGKRSLAVIATPVAPPTAVPTSSAGGEFIGVACPSTSDCVAVGQGGPSQTSGLIEVSTDGGATFTDEPVPAGTPSLEGVTCIDTLHCLAVGGSDVLVTADGGTSWLSEYAGRDLTTVTCTSSTTCVAGGWDNPYGAVVGSAILTTDGGTSWSEAAGFNTSFENVECNVGVCVGVGDNVELSTDGGGSWTPIGIADGGTPSSVACLPTTTSCLAVSPNIEGAFDPTAPGLGFTSTDNGLSWTNSSLPAGSASVHAISCPTSTTCYAFGYSPSASIGTSDGGNTWTTIAGPTNVNPPLDNHAFQNQACSSALDCVMVGSGATGPTEAFTTNGATTWTAASAIG